MIRSTLSRHPRRPLIAAAALALALLGTMVPAARADGGSYPSSAPTLTPGKTVTGGADSTDGGGPSYAGTAGHQYWRIPLKFGDHLRLDVDQVAGYGTGMCIFSPSVTDYTIANSDCLTMDYVPSTNRGELTFTAPRAGDFLVAIWDDYSGESWAYSMTAYVKHRTTLTASGPTYAVQGHYITIRGTMAPAGQHSVLLKSISPAHGWTNAGRVATTAAGKFTFRYHLGHSGPHRFQVFYSGSSRLLAAKSNVVRVNVSPS